MKIELTGANFLSLQELGELAARLDVLHDKTIKAIDRLQGEVEAQKTRIANHWRGVAALGPADRGRVMSEQTSAAIRAIRQNAKTELDGIMRAAGASYGPLVGQRPYWASRAVVLNRQCLATSRRNSLEETAGRARQGWARRPCRSSRSAPASSSSPRSWSTRTTAAAMRSWPSRRRVGATDRARP
jgi:hypothetical protein